MQRARRVAPRDEMAAASAAAAASSSSAAAASPAAAAPSGAAAAPTAKSSRHVRRAATAGRDRAPNPHGMEEVRLAPLRDCLDAEDFPFLYACAMGDVATARRLLVQERAERAEAERTRPLSQRKRTSSAEEPDILLQRMDGFGWSGLHYACAFGHRPILDLLYEFLLPLLPSHLRPVDAHTLLPLSQLKTDSFLHPLYLWINRTNNLYDTPLHVAAYNCHTDCMLWLLQRGADLLIRNSEEGCSALGHTALMCAAEQKELTASAKQVEAVRFLCSYIRQQELEEWADDPAADVESRQRAAFMRRAIQQQSNLTAPMYLTSYDTQPPQQCATAAAALTNLAAKPHSPSPPPPPPTRDSPSFFEESKSESAPTRSLPTASSRSTIGAATHSTSIGESKSSSSDSVVPASAMQDVATPSVTAADTAAATVAATESVSDLESACAYLATFSSINACRGTGSTALMMATFGGDIEVVRVLLSFGAMVEQNLCLATGRPSFDSALLNAVDCGYPDIARLLLQWGANRTLVRGGETAVLILCASENSWFKDEAVRLEFLHLLCFEGVDSRSGPALRSFLLDTPDPLGQTPLSICVRRGYLGVVRWLVNNGCAIPSSEDSMVAHCIDRVAKQREKGTRLKKADVPLCTMLQSFLQQPRCAAQVAQVSPELRAYVNEVCYEADKAKAAALEAAAALAVANAAARRERKRERAPAAAAAASTPAVIPAKLKPTISNSNKRPKHAVISTVPAPASPHSKRTIAAKRAQPSAAAAASKPLQTPMKAAIVAPTTPSQTSSPARWFKGGKLHDHSSVAEASSAGNASRAPSAVSSPLPPARSDSDSDVDNHVDVDASDDLDPADSFAAADHSFDASHQDQDGPSLDLVGDFNHSQVEDHLLNSSDESAHTNAHAQIHSQIHSQINSHLSTPHRPSLLHGASDDDDRMHDDSAGHEDRLHLSMATSPLKFNTSAPSPFRSPQPPHFGLSGGDGGAGSGAGRGLESRHSSHSIGSRGHAVSSFQSNALLHSFEPLLSPEPPARRHPRHQPPMTMPIIISTQSTISSIMTSTAAAAAQQAAAAAAGAEAASGSMILSQEMGEPVLSASADVAASSAAAFGAASTSAFTPAAASAAAAASPSSSDGYHTVMGKPSAGADAASRDQPPLVSFRKPPLGQNLSKAAFALYLRLRAHFTNGAPLPPSSLPDPEDTWDDVEFAAYLELRAELS